MDIGIISTFYLLQLAFYFLTTTTFTSFNNNYFLTTLHFSKLVQHQEAISVYPAQFSSMLNTFSHLIITTTLCKIVFFFLNGFNKWENGGREVVQRS